jgi:Iron-sulfur cluster-binding domain
MISIADEDVIGVQHFPGYGKISDIYMNDFCVAPWTHTYISPQGERRLCCASREPAQNFRQYIDTGDGDGEFRPLTLEEWWNSEHVRQVRTKWLSGTVPPECEVCDKKLLNTNVYRDYFAHLFGGLRDDIISNTSADGTTTLEPISFDYRYSNVCNFKCRMCGDMLSSAWEAEVGKNDLVDWSNPKNKWMRPENRHTIRRFTQHTVVPEFRAAIEAKRVREIYWVGGEPLLYDEHWEFMDRIRELGYADQVRVRYNTNLSRIQDKRGNLYDLLDHFPHWEICASLDGTGDIGEYIRTGLDYADWLVNFRQGIARSTRPRQMRVDFTLTLPGLFCVGPICDLADNLGVDLLSKVVFAFSPDILMSPLALPRHLLDRMIDQLLAIDYSHRTASMQQVLQHLKNRPTFAEQWPEEYQQAARQGKRHLLKLEAIRPDAKLTMDDILATDPEIADWWRNIDA